MSDVDFGLKREGLILRSGVREVFTPHIPVDEISNFFGREDEVSRFVSLVNSPGQHILLYGDRGVGKTSLAVTTCKLILQKLQRGHLFEKKCDSGDTFPSILAEPLSRVGVNLSLKEKVNSHNEGMGAGISAGFAKADLGSKREVKVTSLSDAKPDSPSWVADKIRGLSGLFLIDEADAIQSQDDKKKLAELVKCLSDYNSKFKVVIVGIANTGTELVAGHPSVQRCLKEVGLERMSEDDVRKIILNGMNKVSLRIPDEVVEKIVEISAGFPHFTHLICLKLAETAITNREHHLNSNMLHDGLQDAVRDSQGRLRHMYEESLRSIKNQKEYKLLLLAASYCNTPEFRSAELREKMSQLFNVELDSAGLSRRLTKLTKGEDETILTKPAKGCFQFTDPRMPCFIKMALSEEGKVI